MIWNERGVEERRLQGSVLYVGTAVKNYAAHVRREDGCRISVRVLRLDDNVVCDADIPDEG